MLTQVSIVAPLPSSQFASIRHWTQVASPPPRSWQTPVVQSGPLLQTPAVQVSAVQASPSPHSPSAVQSGTQAGSATQSGSRQSARPSASLSNGSEQAASASQEAGAD